MSRASVLLLLVASGCVELPEFARPSLIDRPRVLAIIAEPPEAAPGQTVELSLLLAGAEQAEISWRACGAFDAVFGGGSQYGQDQEEHCGDGGVPLEPGDRTRLPGELTTRLFADLELAATILGSALPQGSVERVRDEVGLPFLAEATLMADGRRLRAVKRIVISQRPTRHGNPPPPRFTLDGQQIESTPDAPLRCAAPDGAAPVAAPAAELELLPLFEGDTEPWLESYRVLDARGQLVERSERAFYSWFSTAGRMDASITHAPDRGQRWITPADPSCESLWLVIRDGHGGTSACRAEVAVGEAECPP